ncbi:MULTISPECIES: copper uptake system-associated protein [Deefgea]|uniref:Copper uptake system-associated protein n=1 Tax=Deefgea chitinilytica TaxID=570276 RepID=A0ABS2CAX1_9NEIS|nr:MULTISPECIES: copper uptake system-associated protein [Deefgea]MBM5571294.1 copper uptake system-associated protein [Deefgea chitinilytica]MBM9888526.1 copper uptake system-associated protein [Deefgea sp. CFH1-16]
MKRAIIILSLAFASLITPAWADDQSDITASMKAVWDKPDNPLTVKPVIIADDFAIAGWLQGEKGGRALLKKGPHGWQTQLCAGEITSHLLQQAGVPTATAKQLLVQQSAAEKKLSKTDVAQLSSFVGVVKMNEGKGHHHGHEQHHPASTTQHH